jgi:hypothetical protein
MLPIRFPRQRSCAWSAVSVDPGEQVEQELINEIDRLLRGRRAVASEAPGRGCAR